MLCFEVLNDLGKGDDVKSFVILSMIMVLATAVVVGCADKPLQSPPVAQPDYFPLVVGSTWRYAMVDTCRSLVDTMVVTLSRLVVDSSGDTAVERKDSSRYLKLTRYIQRLHDTILFSWGNFQRPLVISDQFILPFDSGRFWANTDVVGDDTVWVTGFEDVTVPAGHYPQAAVIYRKYHFPNDYYRARYWFVKGVGVVKQSELGFDFPYPGRNCFNWELLEYHIPK
jgi:hypothetical protein